MERNDLTRGFGELLWDPLSGRCPWKGGQNSGSEPVVLELTSWVCHFLAVWLWTGDLSDLIFKTLFVSLTMVLVILQRMQFDLFWRWHFYKSRTVLAYWVIMLNISLCFGLYICQLAWFCLSNYSLEKQSVLSLAALCVLVFLFLLVVWGGRGDLNITFSVFFRVFWKNLKN